MSRIIFVFADWFEEDPVLVGRLFADLVRGKEHYSFAYEDDWLLRKDHACLNIDPDLGMYPGPQHSVDEQNFRVFLDSCPDRWGRLLMQRREAVLARQEQRIARSLQESDYLLGVSDETRMGALRFKTDPDGPFLSDNRRLATPPMTSLRELARAVNEIELNNHPEDPEYAKWLSVLIAPGSSLGGARPKASVADETGALWIAKFPSGYDDRDNAAWEYLAYLLAREAGIAMSECRLDQYQSPFRTFLTKRFDRVGGQRIHFSSAMTQLKYHDGEVGASYLELAEFLTNQGSRTAEDLAQLWRRIIFNIAISNVDDHLRNHGFLHDGQGWRLSPAYDLNPTPMATGLSLNIDDKSNELSYDLAFDVAEFFRLTESRAENIFLEVLSAVGAWRAVADGLRIPRSEQESMKSAFRI